MVIGEKVESLASGAVPNQARHSTKLPPFERGVFPAAPGQMVWTPPTAER